MVRGERDRAVGEGKSLRQTITALEQDKQVWREGREGVGERGKKGSRGGWRRGEREGRIRRQTRSHISLTSPGTYRTWKSRCKQLWRKLKL